MPWDVLQFLFNNINNNCTQDKGSLSEFYSQAHLVFGTCIVTCSCACFSMKKPERNKTVPYFHIN